MIYKVELPPNEPVLNYAPGSPEKAALLARIKKMKEEKIEIPLIIGGKEIKSGDMGECRSPHDHNQVVATYHKAKPEHVEMAIEAGLKARKEWAALSWEHRVAIFQRMGDLLAGPYRYTLNAATMLDQSKNAFQAEIDAACELIDFWRFNAYYYYQLIQEQPISSPTMWNRLEHRGLEGFTFAVSPFNFSSIGGNLATSPALCGGVVVWKPASTAVLSGYYLMQIMKEAGMPDGVVNFIPGAGRDVGPNVMKHPELSGIHFTGSTGVFQDMWKTVGNNIANYKYYPRIVGETGGKDFMFAHPSALAKKFWAGVIRAGFEYQGQKCSACSRVYVAKSMWEATKDDFINEIKTIKVGSPEDFGNFMNAVIDASAFKDITEYIDYAKNAKDAEIVVGGTYDDSKGYFIDPTIIVTSDPHFKTMEEEIFGPVVTVFVYEDEKFEETLDICDQTSPYALTGAFWAQDRHAVDLAVKKLTHAAGNFYINDKCTAAVVGQQPFGGGRASGTNDKAGSILNLLRWISPRTIKESWDAPEDYRYPFLGEK